jgi:intein/homing endonuclease
VAQRRSTTLALQGLKLQHTGVSDHVCSGVQPVYRLTTWTGLQIKATAAHPFRTLGGWTPLSELRRGNRLAVARSCPVFGRTPIPEHEATMLGLLLSDGQCRTPRSSPRYTTGDPRLVEEMTRVVRAFGCDISPVADCGYNLVNRRGRGGVVTKNRVYAWLEALNCAELSIHKKIPDLIFRAPRELVATFLRALFSGDGSAYDSTSKKGTRGYCLEYASSSRRMVEDVRHLLLRFGIFALVRSRMSVSGRPAYRVQITDPEMIRRFASEIGFVPGCRKAATLAEFIVDIGDRSRKRSNFDTVPHGVSELLRQAARQAGRSLLSIGVRVPARQQSVPYRMACAVADATADAELREFAYSDVVWDTVRSIEPVGIEPVYDLTVPNGNSFLANDITVHNSTYARCGIICNVTPLEPEWRGKITIEISNTTPLPAKIYANEGIAQILFFRGEGVCRTSYADKKGKYQDQKGLTLPFVIGSNHTNHK